VPVSYGAGAASLDRENRSQVFVNVTALELRVRLRAPFLMPRFLRGCALSTKFRPYAMNRPCAVATPKQDAIIIGIEAKEHFDLMPFHEHNICGVHEAKAAILFLFDHPQGLSCYIVIDHEQFYPSLGQQVRYDGIKALLVE
jgi:hypothetical protein